jgi:phosphatidate cytidylyltransferase
VLRWRMILGVVLVAALAGLAVWDHRTSPPGVWVTLPTMLVLSLVATHELFTLLAARGLNPSRLPVYVVNAALVAVNWLPLAAPHSLLLPHAEVSIVAAGVLALFLAEMRRYERPGVVMERLALGMLAIGYIGLLFSFLAKLRLVDGGSAGIPALLSLILIVKFGDIGAYTVGRLIGRHKMAPVLSPGKTWEGAAGAVVAACLGGWLTGAWLVPTLVTTTQTLPIWHWLLYGVIVGVFGMAGDLAESLIKRDVGRKDSSTWMPGFGGILDVLDSILFAAPVAYGCWLSGLVGA